MSVEEQMHISKLQRLYMKIGSKLEHKIERVQMSVFFQIKNHILYPQILLILGHGRFQQSSIRTIQPTANR